MALLDAFQDEDAAEAEAARQTVGKRKVVTAGDVQAGPDFSDQAEDVEDFSEQAASPYARPAADDLDIGSRTYEYTRTGATQGIAGLIDMVHNIFEGSNVSHINKAREDWQVAHPGENPWREDNKAEWMTAAQDEAKYPRQPFFGETVKSASQENIGTSGEFLDWRTKGGENPLELPTGTGGKIYTGTVRGATSAIPAIVYPPALPAAMGSGALGGATEEIALESGASPELASGLGFVAGAGVNPLRIVRGNVKAPAATAGGMGGRGEEMVRKALDADNLSQAERESAKMIKNNADATGHPVTWGQAVSESTNGRATKLLEIENYLETTEAGRDIITPVMNERPQQFAAAGEKMARDVGGPKLTKEQSAALPHETQASAAAEVKAAQDARTATVKPIYAAGQARDLGVMRPEDVAAADSLLQRPTMSEAWAGAQRIAKDDPTRKSALPQWLETNDKGEITRIIKLPDAETVKYMETALDDIVAKNSDPMTGKVLNQTGRNAANLKRELRGIMQEYVPELKAGDVAYQAESVTKVEPMQRSATGEVAAATPSRAAQADILANKFPEQHPEAIADTFRQMERRTPGSGQAWLTDYLDKQLNKALARSPNQPGGSPQAGGKFNALVEGTPDQQAAIRATIKAMPNGEAKLKVWDNFMQVMRAGSRRKGAGSPTEPRQRLREDLESGPLATVGEAATAPLELSLRGQSQLIDRLTKRMQFGFNTRDMARVLMDSKNDAIFRQMAEMDMNSPNFLRLLGAVFGGTAGSEATLPEGEKRGGGAGEY